MDEMDDIDDIKNICSLCLDLGGEFYLLEHKFQYLLLLISNKMSLEVGEESFICANCLNEIVDLNHFKTIWLASEDILRNKVITADQKIQMEENTCRLCLNVFENTQMSDLLTEVNGISFATMIKFALPDDVILELTYCPIFCDGCSKRIVGMYNFNKKCMTTERKIKTYMENTGTSLKKTNRFDLLFGVKQYFQDGKNKMAKKSKSFFNFFCKQCDFSSIREISLTDHRVSIHPVECILGTEIDEEGGSEFIKLSDYLLRRKSSISADESGNSDQLSIGPNNMANSRESPFNEVSGGGESSVNEVSGGGESSLNEVRGGGESSVNEVSGEVSSINEVNEGDSSLISNEVKTEESSGMPHVFSGGESSAQDTTGQAGASGLGEASCSTETIEIDDTQMDIENPTGVFKCRVCNIFETSKKGNLRRHLDRHTKHTLMHHCSICDFKNKSRVDLLRHEKEHKGLKYSTFKCHICAYCTNTKMNLHKHMERHSSKEENQMFLCPICCISTRSIPDLTAHMKTHEKDNPLLW